MIVYCSIEIVVDCLKVVDGAIGLELGCLVIVVLELLLYSIELVVEASYCCILVCYHLYQSTDLLLLYS
jgi:hypothetical protein